MALVGHISGSSQSNSTIGISGSVIIANEPDVRFPQFPGSDISFFVSGSTNARSEGYGASIFGGQLVVSGASFLEGGIYATSISGSGNFEVGGDLIVAGDVRINGNDIKSATGATAITLNGPNVVIPGDLTVNGTTTTVNTNNLEIKDSIIGLGFASGSIAQTVGDRAIIGGMLSEDNVIFLWDEDQNEFAIGRTSHDPTGSGPVTMSSYAQFHALGLTGSLTKLSDGTDYLRAGSNISLTTGSSGEVTVAVTGMATGDVVGPASATNDAIAVYDGTTGKLIKNSNLSVGTRTTTQNYVTASVNLNNYGLALIPSGTGPLSARAPDGTAIGGDARGSNAVDFQMVRASSSQVAEGIRSVIVGGQNNRAIGESATIVGGSGNVVSARFGFIGSGENNTAGEYSFVGTGGSNNCTAERSFIGGGNSNSIASGISRSAIVNGNQNVMTVSGIGATEGQFIGSGRFNAVKHTFSSIVGGDTNTASSTHTFIGGGNLNVVSGSYSAVVGGQYNSSSKDYTFVGGGQYNTGSGTYSSVVGGSYNQATGLFSVIVGGGGTIFADGNLAVGDYSTIVGGQRNAVSARYGFIGAGAFNSAGEYCFIGSGNSNNCSTAVRSFIGDGSSNSISGVERGTIVNGQSNTIAAATSGFAGDGQFIGGGRFNLIRNNGYSSVVGGDTNTASSAYTFIGGGNANVVSGSYSVVVGGQYNSSSAGYVFVGGGQYNTGSGLYSSAVGGVNNIASGERSFVGGGGSTTKVLANVASGQSSTVVGGENNEATSTYTTIVGGRNNTASSTDAFIGGGRSNVASNQNTVVCGGETNQSTGLYSFVGGGLTNYSTNTFTTIAGGNLNYANGSNSTICGGTSNSALGGSTFIGGGQGNSIVFNATDTVIAGGQYNNANGYSHAFVGGGQYNTGSGQYSSVVGGLSNTAQSYGETSFGLYSTTGTGNQTSYVSTDRLFVVGNGTSSTARSNALTLIKNGDMHLSGTLTLMSGSTSGITFPTTRGTNGQVLTSDGAGLITWQTPTMQPSYFTSTTAGSIYVTGSTAFIGNEVGIDSPYDKGSDVSFYVSGSTDGASIALFGGNIATSGSLSVFGNTTLGDTTSDLITFNARVGTNFLPANDNQYDLGSSSNRWANVYTGDLHLKNDRGDWTVIEEDEYLSLRNNKTGKLYRLVMEPVEE